MEGLEDPSISEFIQHPSYRQVSTFFLGFVFITCIRFTFHLPLAAARRIHLYLQGRSLYGGVGLEANRPAGEEKVQGWLGSNRSTHTTTSSVLTRLETNNLALSLTVCFAMASVANFGSLLVFDAKTGLAGCAFLVAWGGMAAQSARILGLLKLSLDLKKLGVRKWETYLFWGWLVGAMIVMFVTNAISIGVIKPLPGHRTHDALCYRKHFVGTAVVSSVLDIVLEIYCLLRIYYLIVPAFLSPRHKFDALLDIRASRAISLLILDLITAVPAAHFFNLLADFIPASLASLIVLVAFNQRSPNVALASTASIPGTRPDSMRSRSTIEIKKMPSNRSLAEPRQRVSHPFAASALQDPSYETEDWPASASPEELEKPYIPFPQPATPPQAKRQTWRNSNQSTVSESDSDVARSVKGAVVGFAFKDVVGTSRRQREHSFLPAMPTMSETTVEARSEILPRTTPLRIPRPVVPPQAKQVEAIERASRYEHGEASPALSSPLLPAPDIAITNASPVSPPVTRTPSSKPSISISVPSSNSTNGSAKSSLHLTPSTPAHPQSRRASSSDGEWRFDSRHDSFGSHRSSDEPTPEQVQRQSMASSRLPPADDDLSIVYEASHEDSDSMPPSRAYRPTFGEHMFVEGGIGRPISTPIGVPEDVGEGGQSNGSQSSSSNKSRSIAAASSD